MDGSRNRRENIYAFSNLHGYVWTGPKWQGTNLACVVSTFRYGRKGLGRIKKDGSLVIALVV